MADICLAIAVMTAVSAGSFWFALKLTHSASMRMCDLYAILVFLLMIAYIRYLWDDMVLAELLPFGSLIVIGNWFPPMACLLAGIGWRRIQGSAWRKLPLPAALVITGLYSMMAPFWGTAPICGEKWAAGEICVQTSHKTCSAASAATLLRWHGIQANEQEMATLCFTREGTTWQGLYHGLKTKTKGTPWDVEVFACEFEELRSLNSTPLILSVGLDENKAFDKTYQTEWGWTPGVRHSVLLLDFIHTWGVDIADPSPEAGREIWSVGDLQVLWRKQGMRLVKRNPAEVTATNQ